MPTLKIERLAHGGEGIGFDADGRATFVPRTVPGDIVEVEVLKQKKRWAKAKVLSIVTPSPMRIESTCDGFSQGCGGCQFWNISYADELKLKSDAALETLKRISKREIPTPKVIAANATEGYRCRVTAQQQNGVVGFYKHASHELVSPESCPVLIPTLSDYVLKAGNSGLCEIDMNGNLACEDEPGPMTVDVPGLGSVEVPSGLFRQANMSMNATLVDTAASLLPGGESLLELYCGYGNFTFSCAEKYASILAVEGSREAIATANTLNPHEHVSFRAERIDKSTEILATHILLDPPRAGAKEVMQTIEDSDANLVVYVSCEVSALARDLGLLDAAWNIDSVTFVDMFPRTAHLEAVVRITR